MSDHCQLVETAYDRSAVRRCLFGTDLRATQVILTPSSTMYTNLGAGLIEGGGWWPIRVCGSGAVVRTPQGSAVMDALAALEPGAEIVFVGFCGALGAASRHRIGAIVEAASADLLGVSLGRTSDLPFRYPAVRVVTVRSLFEGTTKAPVLESAAEVVDMEVAHVFDAATCFGHRARAWLVVSDRPGTPFYDTTDDDILESVAQLARDARQILKLHNTVVEI